MRAPARLHLFAGGGNNGNCAAGIVGRKKERNASGWWNWNKQGNHKWWLRAARGGSCIKDEALQARLTGWSPGQLWKLSANALLWAAKLQRSKRLLPTSQSTFKPSEVLPQPNWLTQSVIQS